MGAAFSEREKCRVPQEALVEDPGKLALVVVIWDCFDLCDVP